MLQKLEFDGVYHEEDRSYLLRPAFYIGLLKRRLIYFLVPFILIATIGTVGAFLWPATYLSEGKILVQTQQIPTELVRPTVTTLANERIQVIEQRVMTRDNLIAIIDKFQLFPEQKDLMSVTELIGLMRKNTKIVPVTLMNPDRKVRLENQTIAFTVGFQHPNPVIANRVANDLVTRILNEDLRDRTSRATDTTKFLTREVQKLRTDAAAMDRKISEVKGKGTGTSSDQATNQLTQLKIELAQKSLVYSEQHPTLQSLKRQIDALQTELAHPVGLDALEAQQAVIQKNLEETDKKLSAARMGEALERDQQSEKLDVIEQPTEPQEPVSPNRPKVIGLALALALMAGGGLAFIVEIFDKAIRRPSDLFSVVDSQLVVSIPYIATKAELAGHKKKIWRSLMAVAAVLVAVLIVAYIVLPPLDLMIAKARVGLFR